MTGWGRARGRGARLLGTLALGALVLGTAGTGPAHATAPTHATDRAPSTASPGVPADFIPGKVIPLAHGHAHNDYFNELPLADALVHGFTSVEVDVVLLGGRLLVGHDLVDALLRNRTLEELYLGPLRAWTTVNGGKIFADPRIGFTLLIDVKSGSDSTYRALDKVLASYRSVLTRYTRTSVVRGPVTAIVSGHRARATMAAQAVRYAAYDGRAADLDATPTLPATEMPMVSENWANLFSWDGRGEMPPAERAALHALAHKGPARGRGLRLFNTPAGPPAAREAVWREEMAARVDLLNIDDLDAGQQFLLSYPEPSKPYVPMP